jgi:hypothetical protein
MKFACFTAALLTVVMQDQTAQAIDLVQNDFA